MNIMWFCIPAYGHTNPTIEPVRALVKRGHTIRYYSFEEFRGKIEDTGAVFIPCDGWLPPADAKTEKRLRRVSATEMSVQSFGTLARMDGFLTREIADFQPDGIVSDSACFWGKLTALKHGLKMVCSTTTFAFNRYSSRYMRQSFGEILDLLCGIGRMKRAADALRPLGYPVKSPLEIVQNTNDTDTIVYTSRRFQPCAESFDPAHYRFVGPSVKDTPVIRRTGQRPLVYVSLGTVINNRPDFYRRCIRAVEGEDMELLISCGKAFDREQLGPLPENVRAEHYVNQMEVLAEAGLFITHCGMNSASEGLYMGVPELLFPLTGEQRAVARRVQEMGAGRLLTKKDAASPASLRRAIQEALDDAGLRAVAMEIRADFRACGGAKEAAEFIEECFARSRGSFPEKKTPSVTS